MVFCKNSDASRRGIAEAHLKFCPRHCEEPTGPAFGGPDDKLRDEAIQFSMPRCGIFAEPVIGRAFARPVGGVRRVFVEESTYNSSCRHCEERRDEAIHPSIWVCRFDPISS